MLNWIQYSFLSIFYTMNSVNQGNELKNIQEENWFMRIEKWTVSGEQESNEEINTLQLSFKLLTKVKLVCLSIAFHFSFTWQLSWFSHIQRTANLLSTQGQRHKTQLELQYTTTSVKKDRKRWNSHRQKYLAVGYVGEHVEKQPLLESGIVTSG